MKLLDVLTSPWAIVPDKYHEIVEIYDRHLKGDKIDISKIEAQLGRPLDNTYHEAEIVGGVGIISVNGVIARRANLFSRISGGVSTEFLQRDFAILQDDPQIHSIVLYINSPGGTVDGTKAAADFIYNARGDKKIVTLANGMMASAAYWIGSAADSIYIEDETTFVGSIGVITTHVDYSEAQKRAGIKVTELFSGRYKAVGSSNKPLSEDDRAIIQSDLDTLYSIFIKSVAKNRGASVKSVLDNMADGRIFIGQQAIDAGLVDGVSTLSALVNSLNGGGVDLPRRGGGSAQTATTSKQTKAEQGKMEITKGFILENHPEIAEAFRSEGRAEINVDDVKKQSFDAGYAAGKSAELERVKGVFDSKLPGHDAAVEQMAFDGKTSPAQAAAAVIAAEREKRANVRTLLGQDAEATANIPATATPSNETRAAAEDENIPLEERLKTNWSASAKLRNEYDGDFDRYAAFERANRQGLVKYRKQNAA